MFFPPRSPNKQQKKESWVRVIITWRRNDKDVSRDDTSPATFTSVGGNNDVKRATSQARETREVTKQEL
jgi:hypothetical protein